MRYTYPEPENMYEALGAVTMLYREIEDQCDSITEDLSALIDPVMTDDWPLEILDTILSCLNLRAKLPIIKALSTKVDILLKDSKIEVETYSIISRLFDHIDKFVRTSRNRYIHDKWEYGDGNYYRVERGIKIKKPQARKSNVATTAKWNKYEDFSEVKLLFDNMSFVLKDLNKLDNYLIALSYHKEQPKSAPLPVPFANLSCISHHEEHFSGNTVRRPQS